MVIVEAKPWITDPRDRAYIETRLRRLAELEDERKRLQRQVNEREARVWDTGGRARYLWPERFADAVEREVAEEPCPKCRVGFLCDEHRQAVA